MSTFRTPAAAALALVLIATSPLMAHEAAKGRNGGLRVDAGKYHTELVVDGSTNVVVYMSDADDKPMAATGFKATAILLIDGKAQRIELLPLDSSKLVGTAPVAINPGVKGVVQVTSPDGGTQQGKF